MKEITLAYLIRLIEAIKARTCKAIAYAEKHIQREGKRLLPLFIVLAALAYTDPAGFGVIAYMLALMTVIALFSHVMRRMLFPYLDMKIISDKADESPMSSAIVFASIAFIVGCIIITVGGMLS